MAEPIVLSIKGIDDFRVMLQRKDRLAMQKAQEALLRISLVMEAKIKDSISHGTYSDVAFDTGNFMRSTHSEVENFTAIIYNNADYGAYIEYGTSKMVARPHFRNTLFSQKGIIERFFKDKIKEIEGA